MLSVVCRMFVVVCRLLPAVRCSRLAVRCRVNGCFFFKKKMCVCSLVRLLACSLSNGRCPLFVACCLLRGVGCSSYVVCCRFNGV